MFNKTTLVFLILFLQGFVLAFSQNNRIDSLKGVVDKQSKDTSMVSALNALCVEYLTEGDFTASFKYGAEANELATKLNDLEGKAYALKNIGIGYYYQGEYITVFDYWTQSLETFEAMRDTLGMSNMLNNLGGVYLSQGGSDKALEYFLRSLSFAEAMNDPLRITSVLPNIGAVYGQMGDYEKAITYFNQMEQYLEILDDPQITTYYLMGIGEIYVKMNNYEKALKYYEDALALNKDSERYPHNLTMLGTIESNLGNDEKAIDYMKLAYQEATSRNQQWDVVEALIALGRIYKDKDFELSVSSFEEAEELANENPINRSLRDIYQGLAQSYSNHGDYANAFKYQTKYLAQKDSLFNLETDDKIRGLQFDFDLSKKEDEIGLLEKEAEIQELQKRRQKNVIYATGIALFLIILLALSLYRRYKFIRETNLIIETEKNRSESLLLNILPEETAQELKENGRVTAKSFEAVTVLFTDFVGFTAYAKNLKPEELVNSVDYYFSKFDEIMERHDVEKIKTIGDAYMCAGGLPEPDENHVFNVIEAAFEIIDFIDKAKKSNLMSHQAFDIRIGVNTGPIVAGVVGTKKFAYDIWGDTVNVASRMETKSEPGKINVSESTYELIKDKYECEYRGEIDVKNKGMMKMFFVNGPKKPTSEKTQTQEQSV